MGKTINLNSGDNEFSAYLATPESGKGPGILLCHAWWGLNDLFTGLADRLAAEGFTVLAPDVFKGKVASTREGAEELADSADSDVIIGIEQTALDYLLSSAGIEGDKVGVVGVSFGVAYATWLASLRPEVAAVVTFYGGSDWNADYDKNATAPLLSHWASDDEFEATESVQAFEDKMKAANRTFNFYTYPDTKHWFFESDRPEYVAEAADLAWERTIAFLHKHLG